MPPTARSLVIRFYEKIRVGDDDDCWEWTGTRRRDGYGRMKTVSRSDIRAHRFSYEHFIGPTMGLFVCHKCDNPGCVNPAHLFLGTCKENMQDAARKGRVRRGEQLAFSKLTERDVRYIRRLLAKGFNQRAIGRRFGIANQTVSEINTGKIWRHLANPPGEPITIKREC